MRLFRRRRPVEPQIVEVFRYREVPRPRGTLVIWGGTISEAERFARQSGAALHRPIRCLGDTSVRSAEGMLIDTVIIVGTAGQRVTKPVMMHDILQRCAMKSPQPVRWLDLRRIA